MTSHLRSELRRLIIGVGTSISIFGPILSHAQTPSDFESRKTTAYQRFHNGEVHQAAREIRILANEATDKATKTYLLRDLTEICAAAYEANCTLEAETEAFQNANSETALKPLIPELYSYFISAQVWFSNKDTLKEIFKDNPLASFNSGMNPAAAAFANLAAISYFVRSSNRKAAESAYSTALMSLLLMDPNNKYAISKVLVEMFEALIGQQDIVGALSLARTADSYLTANLNHNGPFWAKYAYLAAELVAITNRQVDVVPALAEAARLNERQDINEGAKLYRLATNNSLQSLALIFQGKFEDASRVHSRHPLQPIRQTIIDRGNFDTLQEFFFAVSDTIIQNLGKTKLEETWKPLFEKAIPAKWDLEALQWKNLDSYRNFTLGVIASNSSKVEAANLYQLAARQRIDNFEIVLKGRFEGFQLPTAIDFLIVEAALTSIIDYPPADQNDLMLRGSEMLLRTLRHQLSDFSVLIGSQDTDEARSNARSYHLLIEQKQNWEFQQIKSLLEGGSRNVGALLNTYPQLVRSVSQLKEEIAKRSDYNDTIGYPDLKQIQAALNEREILITYFPTFKGIGRLCIARDKAVSSFSGVDFLQLSRDVKLLQYALTADYAADEYLDSQYPAASALRVRDFLFSGLERCATAGSHINVAMPDDVAGIPLAALLEEMPPRAGEGFDLTRAKWLGNTFSFSTTVSARQFVGSRRAIIHRWAQRPYLGVGNPDLSNGLRVPGNRDPLKLVALPETAYELSSVQKLLGADNSEILEGSAATEEAFRSKDLGKYDVVHFATHGLLKGDVGTNSESALVLTPVDFYDSFDDGLLTSSEITRLSLNARLIVLSACNTAKIDTNAANIGAADLQSAFSVAGAPTLLAALWTVETTTAQNLITEFFKSWQPQREKSASEALATAMRAYLKRSDRAHQHPRFWAPFVVFGYGDKMPSSSQAIAKSVGSIRELPGGTAGEIVDAKSYRDRIVISMQGEWDGHTMASIIKDPASVQDHGTIRSHEIGAGKLITAGPSLYTIGYRTSPHPFPILRKLEDDGRVAWEKNFEDLSDYTFTDGEIVNDTMFLLADPFAQTTVRKLLLIEVNLFGSEIRRTSITAPPPNLLIGAKSKLSKTDRGVLIAVMSQGTSELDIKQRATFGMPLWCRGAPLTTIYFFEHGALNVITLTSVENFQASVIRKVDSDIILGGETRDRCSQNGSASLLKIDAQGKSHLFWRDTDLFASNIQSFERVQDGLAILVKRERPIGVRSIASKETSADSKRWGDDGVNLWEFSLIRIGKEANSLSRYDSSFGLSSFAQGIVVHRDSLIVFGSLGGRPAISEMARPAAP
jgi:CHAT domain